MIHYLKAIFKKSFTPLNLITISRQRLVDNYHSLQSRNHAVKIAPVLKSNAYGHGIALTGKIFDKVHAPFLCVDSLYEAFQVYSKAGAKTPILIMGYIHPKSLAVKKLPFRFAIYDLQHATVLNKYQKGAKVHIFIDTGMHREGVTMEDLPDFLKELKKLKDIEVEGVMSHFAELSKPDSDLTKLQINNFEKAKEMISKEGFNPKWFHLGGMLGLIKGDKLGANMVRIGKALYGVDDADSKQYNLDIKPALKFQTRIVQIKKIKKGEKVGYSGTYIAPSERTIAILPLGYNDGVDRRLSNKAYVTVKGVKCPVVGLVSMNITTIDITDVKNAVLDTEAVFISDNPEDPNSIANLSEAGVILPHEMLIHIAESTKRVVV